jgi:hypothetical protein
MGVGEKVTSFGRTGELCLKFYVREKLPRTLCSVLVPKEIVTATAGTVITDVEAVGDLRPLADPTDKARPAPAGCSIGLGLATGTLGCFVTKTGDESKAIYALSNAHVIARDGNASPGADIYQPAKVDSPDSECPPFAQLTQAFPFTFSETEFANLVDAAIAQVADPGSVDPDIMEIGQVAGLSEARQDMAVKKFGRTTELTFGTVRDVHFRTRLQFEMNRFGSVGSAGFRDQILVSRFSDSGDSGSLVLDEDNNAVGLLFAGSDQVSICNKIQNVISALDVEIYNGYSSAV